jgi:hypothetical protein
MTEILGFAGCLLTHGASWVIKWDVQPESAMIGEAVEKEGGLRFVLIKVAL